MNKDINLAYLQKPTFLIGAPKSGTTLLKALFDWHPQLVVIPVEIEYYRKYDGFIEPESGKPKTNFHQIILSSDSKISWMRHEISHKHPNESKRDFTNMNFDVFKEHILSYDFTSFTRKDYFQNIFEAYRKALQRITADLNGFLTKSIGDLYHIAEIMKDFPNAKFIHVLRDPRDNYVSYCKARPTKLAQWPEYAEISVGVITEKILPSFKIGVSRGSDQSGNYQTVRYEDLAGKTESVMRQLAEFVGIDWDDALLSPTLCGNPWGGNSSEHTHFRGVSKKSLGRYKQELSTKQVETIERYVYNEMKAFQYVPEIASKPLQHATLIKAFLYLKKLKMRTQRIL